MSAPKTIIGSTQERYLFFIILILDMNGSCTKYDRYIAYCHELAFFLNGLELGNSYPSLLDIQVVAQDGISNA